MNNIKDKLMAKPVGNKHENITKTSALKHQKYVFKIAGKPNGEEGWTNGKLSFVYKR